MDLRFERSPIKNSSLGDSTNEFTTGFWLAEFETLDPRGTVDFLRSLIANGVYLPLAVLDKAFSDEYIFVRSWVAAHLEMRRRDYRKTKATRSPRAPPSNESAT